MSGPTETADAPEPPRADDADTTTPRNQGELWRDAQAKLGTADYVGAISELA
ncbi:MAG: hypothetical protein JKY37_11635, partial [Nannocystaceae bacterium]|nr:hypothetical protein [Nannocystaceae bacterium]